MNQSGWLMVHVMSGFNVAVARIVLFYFQVIRRVDDEMAVEGRNLAAKPAAPVVDGGSEKIPMTVTWCERLGRGRVSKLEFLSMGPWAQFTSHYKPFVF